MPAEKRPPALVLGGAHSALGAMRALARHGIPQFNVGAGSGFVSRSRWHRRLPVESGEDPRPDTLASFLARLRMDRMVLFPCNDAWVAAVAALEPELAARYPASSARRDSIEICLDKGRFAEALARLGLPHPRTIRITGPGDVPALWDANMRDPFLKPANSGAFRARYGAKALRVATPEEAIARVRDAQRARLDLLLQEYVPGPASAHCFVDGFVDRTGAVRARFARRRVRTYPEPFGDSSCMVSIPLAEMTGPLAILDRLLPALDFRGVFNAQFKHDRRDGHYKLLDFNPRVWGGVALAVSSGIDLVAMAYRDALGLPVPTVTEYPVGRHWMFQSRDLLACWHLARGSRPSAAAWLRTWVGAVHPIFAWDDPAPAAALAVDSLRRTLRRRAAVRGTTLR